MIFQFKATYRKRKQTEFVGRSAEITNGCENQLKYELPQREADAAEAHVQQQIIDGVPVRTNRDFMKFQRN